MAGSVISSPKPGMRSISYGQHDPKWNFFFKDLLYLFPFWEGGGLPRDVINKANISLAGAGATGPSWILGEQGLGYEMGEGRFQISASEVPKLDPMTYMQLRRIDHDGSTSGTTYGIQWNCVSLVEGYRWSWYNGRYRLLIRYNSSSYIHDLLPGVNAQDAGDYILNFISHNSAGTNRGFTTKNTFFNLTKKASDSYQESTWNTPAADLTSFDRNWTDPLTFGVSNAALGTPPASGNDNSKWYIAATWQRELSSEERRKIAEDPFGPLRPFMSTHIKVPAVATSLWGRAKIFDLGSNTINWKPSAPINIIIKP